MLKEESILIIDKDTILRRMISEFLEVCGLDVSGTDNASSALEILKTNNFGIIIIDYNLPDINGIDLVRIIRHQYPHAFIIGISIKQVKEEFLKSGADNFLQKFFHFGHLLTLIISHLKEQSGGKDAGN